MSDTTEKPETLSQILSKKWLQNYGYKTQTTWNSELEAFKEALIQKRHYFCAQDMCGCEKDCALRELLEEVEKELK